MEYVVQEAVVIERATPRGLERVEFVAGTVADPSEDERYFLEYVLIPRGLARRATKGNE